MGHFTKTKKRKCYKLYNFCETKTTAQQFPSVSSRAIKDKSRYKRKCSQISVCLAVVLKTSCAVYWCKGELLSRCWYNIDIIYRITTIHPLKSALQMWMRQNSVQWIQFFSFLFVIVIIMTILCYRGWFKKNVINNVLLFIMD